jgi:hypothetical protein
MEVFFSNVGHFESFRGFLNTFSWKWRLFFRNAKLLKDILKEVEASVSKCKTSIKISIIFEDFFRKIEAFSRIARLFKYIFSGIEAFSKRFKAFFAMILWRYKSYCCGGFLVQVCPWPYNQMNMNGHWTHSHIFFSISICISFN